MYNTHFGFREKPFKLVPNPEYLFLSKTHEIALAHLTYATDQGEGFVVIVGEVGTGKTTLCRNYLESLDEQTESAYIFNPRLDTNELLAGICHEYGIETNAESTKALLDSLNAFLIEQNAAGHKVVLLIDEAQLLSVESLELVRMLSNLETTKNKLLQIILVGQPELAAMLETYELRQLAQRISLNYRLTPLSQQDTQAYIQHRIGIASQKQTKIFSPDACRLAYRYAGGIPRLINIVADRALLVAFSHNQEKVTKSAVQTAIFELTSSSQARPNAPVHRPVLLWSGICASVIILAAMFFFFRAGGKQLFGGVEQSAVRRTMPRANAAQKKSFKIPDMDANETPATQPNAMAAVQEVPSATEKDDAGQKTSVPEPIHEPTTENSAPADGPSAIIPEIRGIKSDFEKLIETLAPQTSRKSSAAVLLSKWQQPRPNVDLVPSEVDDYSFFDITARQYGLRRHVVRGNWDLIKKIDLPAILTLRSPKVKGNVYLSLVGWQGGNLQLSSGLQGSTIKVPFDSLKPYIDGPIHIFWRNIIGFDMIIAYGADERAVLMVKNLLRKIGYQTISLSPDFDEDTRKAVRNFQAGHHLGIDGLVGPLTKILLLREAGTAEMPHLSAYPRLDS